MLDGIIFLMEENKNLVLEDLADDIVSEIREYAKDCKRIVLRYDSLDSLIGNREAYDFIWERLDSSFDAPVEIHNGTYREQKGDHYICLDRLIKKEY